MKLFQTTQTPPGGKTLLPPGVEKWKYRSTKERKTIFESLTF